MATKREYLVSKGLAKPTRGRFNKAALAELERARQDGMTFDDDEGVGSEESEPAPPPQPYVKPEIYSPPVRRDIDSVIGYTDEGAKVVSDVCFFCCQHVTRCDCREGIVPSPIVTRWDPESEPYGAPLTSPSAA
jgi:hypothetical protein